MLDANELLQMIHIQISQSSRKTTSSFYERESYKLLNVVCAPTKGTTLIEGMGESGVGEMDRS